MSTATLSIDLDAIRANWRALNEKTGGETAAVVKANAYGLGAGFVAKALLKEGVQTFFVAVAEEGVVVRKSVGHVPTIYVFGAYAGRHGIDPRISPDAAAKFCRSTDPTC